MNEWDFPHLVEVALPPGPFRRVILEIDAFHRYGGKRDGASGGCGIVELAFSTEHSNRDHDAGGQYDHARKHREVSQDDGHVSPAKLTAYLGGVLMLGRGRWPPQALADRHEPRPPKVAQRGRADP